MDDWNDYFWGEVVTNVVEFEEREEMYQAFKGRLLSELNLAEKYDDD